MRLKSFVSMVLLLSAAWMLNASPTFASPVTGGTGPGGVGLTNGASGLVVWLKNNTGLFQDVLEVTPATSPNDPIARWRDSSGWNRHADQSTGSLQPSFQTGGPNAANIVQFAADGLVTPNFGLVQSGASPVHVFSTLKFASSSGNASIMDGSGINQMRVYVVSDSVFHLNGGGDISGAVTNPLQYHNYAFGFAGTGSYIRSDSMSVASGSLGGGASPGVVALGRSPGTGEFANIDVPEYIVFNQTVSSVQQVMVENYLSSKFNVGPVIAGLNNSLPVGADHYDGDLSGAGNFDFGVFGIGHDGTSAITSAGHEGLGIENNSIASGDWVLAGHSNGPNGLTPLNPFSGQRWQRSWYLDRTNVTSADLKFDWNDAGIMAAFDPNLVGLLYSPFNGGPFTLLANGTVNIGNQSVEFLNVPLSDGYYTLGIVGIPEPSTFALLGLGTVGMAIRTRRRRSANC